MSVRSARPLTTAPVLLPRSRVCGDFRACVQRWPTSAAPCVCLRASVSVATLSQISHTFGLSATVGSGRVASMVAPIGGVAVCDADLSGAQ
jgi:hypothetical protein